MTKKVTSENTIQINKEEKEKRILKPQDFEKEITGRKKSPQTYIRDLNLFLKFLIDINIDLKLIFEFYSLLELYINVFPDIKKLTNIFFNISNTKLKLSLIEFLAKNKKNGTMEQNQKFYETNINNAVVLQS